MLLEWRGRVKGSRLKKVELASVTQLSTSISALGRESNGEKNLAVFEEAIGGFQNDGYFDTALIRQLLTASRESLHYMTHFLHLCTVATIEEYITFFS